MVLRLFHVLCPESSIRPWLTKVIHLMNAICVYILSCVFRVMSAEWSHALGTKCLGTSGAGCVPSMIETFIHVLQLCSVLISVQAAIVKSAKRRLVLQKFFA